MTKIQDLRDRVILLKRRIIEEVDGTFNEIWQDGDVVWAQVVPCMGRENYGEEWNNLAPIQAKYKVILRFRRGHFARVRWEGITLALLCPPIMDQRRQWLKCWMYALGEDHG